MKLFQQLLIAPAALGLLAPLAANADVLEYKSEDLSAGAFASATKMSGGSVFTTGFIDTANTANNKLTTEYNYSVDINSSFSGLDNLHVGLEAGNQGELVMDSAINSASANAVEVASLYYEFPVGGFQITAGPLLDQDDVISATTSIYSDSFRLTSMPWGTAGDTGAGVGVAYVADNGWNGSFNVLSVAGNNSTVGMFTEEAADQYTASVGYDAANYGGGVIYTSEDQTATDTVDESIGLGAYFRPDGFPTISLAYDKLRDENGQDSKDFLIGLDHSVGSGTLSAAYQAADRAGTTTTNYEVYYNYPVNDGVSVQGGLFSEEVSGADNTQGFIVETFFSF